MARFQRVHTAWEHDAFLRAGGAGSNPAGAALLHMTAHACTPCTRCQLHSPSCSLSRACKAFLLVLLQWQLCFLNDTDIASLSAALLFMRMTELQSLKVHGMHFPL